MEKNEYHLRESTGQKEKEHAKKRLFFDWKLRKDREKRRKFGKRIFDFLEEKREKWGENAISEKKMMQEAEVNAAETRTIGLILVANIPGISGTIGKAARQKVRKMKKDEKKKKKLQKRC